jgi:hypothetical protein
MTGHLRSLAFVRNKAYASAPERAGHRRIAAVPFTLRNFKEDLEDVGSRFDGAPDLEFRLATGALELEKSGLSYQSVPPTNRWRAGATRAGAWRGTAGVWTPLRVRGIERVRLHADLTILAKLSCALARARVVSLAA